jgi:hypothetical protein
MDQNLRLEINGPHVVAQVIEGEVVAINMDSGCYFSMRDSASDIWSLVSEGWTMDETVAALGHRYLGEPGVIYAEAFRFVQELLDEQLLRPGTAAAPGPVESDASSHTLKALLPPVLERFTDMEDLLLLDPVHDVGGEGWPHASPAPDHGN